MRKFLLKACAVGLLALLLFAALLSALAFAVPGAHDDSYQKGFVLQYRALERSDPDTRKAIVVGTSYMAFSVDTEQLSGLLGMPVYSLGVNAGMGEAYILESARKFIRSGDLVIKPLVPFDPSHYGIESIFITLDGERDLLWDFMKTRPMEVVRGANTMAVTKLYGLFVSPLVEKLRSSFLTGEGLRDPYRIQSFSETGNLIFHSEECVMGEDELKATRAYRLADYSDRQIASLNEFNAFCGDRGATLLFTFPPLYESVLTTSGEELEGFERGLAALLDAPVISDVRSSLYPRELMFNVVLHLNSMGKRVYTERLHQDIASYLQSAPI